MQRITFVRGLVAALLFVLLAAVLTPVQPATAAQPSNEPCTNTSQDSLPPCDRGTEGSWEPQISCVGPTIVVEHGTIDGRFHGKTQNWDEEVPTGEVFSDSKKPFNFQWKTKPQGFLSVTFIGRFRDERRGWRDVKWVTESPLDCNLPITQPPAEKPAQQKKSPPNVDTNYPGEEPNQQVNLNKKVFVQGNCNNAFAQLKVPGILNARLKAATSEQTLYADVNLAVGPNSGEHRWVNVETGKFEVPWGFVRFSWEGELYEPPNWQPQRFAGNITMNCGLGSLYEPRPAITDTAQIPAAGRIEVSLSPTVTNIISDALARSPKVGLDLETQKFFDSGFTRYLTATAQTNQQWQEVAERMLNNALVKWDAISLRPVHLVHTIDLSGFTAGQVDKWLAMIGDGVYRGSLLGFLWCALLLATFLVGLWVVLHAVRTTPAPGQHHWHQQWPPQAPQPPTAPVTINNNLPPAAPVQPPQVIVVPVPGPNPGGIFYA